LSEGIIVFKGILDKITNTLQIHQALDTSNTYINLSYNESYIVMQTKTKLFNGILTFLCIIGAMSIYFMTKDFYLNYFSASASIEQNVLLVFIFKIFTCTLYLSSVLYLLMVKKLPKWLSKIIPNSLLR